MTRAALLPIGVNLAQMYAKQILDQVIGQQRLVQRELNRVLGGLVLRELVLQLLDRPRGG